MAWNLVSAAAEASKDPLHVSLASAILRGIEALFARSFQHIQFDEADWRSGAAYMVFDMMFCGPMHPLVGYRFDEVVGTLKRVSSLPSPLCPRWTPAIRPPVDTPKPATRNIPLATPRPATTGLSPPAGSPVVAGSWTSTNGRIRGSPEGCAARAFMAWVTSTVAAHVRQNSPPSSMTSSVTVTIHELIEYAKAARAGRVQ